MISAARQEVAGTVGIPPLGGSCLLLQQFLSGTLQGDDYLQLLYHLDSCPRCFHRVRSFPPGKRLELYALKDGLEEVVLEDTTADQKPDREEDFEEPLKAHEDPPTEIDLPAQSEQNAPSIRFSSVVKLLKQEIRETSETIEKLKARLAALQDRRAELEADLKHLQAATRVIERFKPPSAPRTVSSVPFVRPRTSFANLTQREAILQILRQNPRKALDKRLLTQALIEGGFPFRSADRAERRNGVYQTCRRMVEKQELLMTIRGRHAFYQLTDIVSQKGHRNVARAAAG